MRLNIVALVVFTLLFLFITWLGFIAAKWRRGDLDMLHEWGLGGRRFGTIVTWFLIGGDLYTAYTFIAVPALLYGAGALGFFAVPYTIMIYPLLFVCFPRLWKVAHANGYVTASDYVRGRFNNRWLALAVAVTGIVATMPYIALQLVGIQVVIGAMGVETSGWLGDLPLIIAFIILAAFTYSSGLRAPAMIAVVKDVLIYVAVIAAVVVVPWQLGGFGKIFAAVPAAKQLLATPPAGSGGAITGYATLAFGSALALFLYPHSLTGILASQNSGVLRRNAAMLPAYSLLLGLLALIGFFAIAAGVSTTPELAAGFKAYGNNFAVPALFLKSFPDWFVGVAFAAIGIGALVPAAIMSIATANTFTRNIWREFFRPAATDAQESQIAKVTSLVIKFGALVFVFCIPFQYALYLQTLGGMWMIQVLPAVLLSLYCPFFGGRAMLVGWAVGTISATWLAIENGVAPIYAFKILGYTFPCYIAVATLALNIVVSAILSPLLRHLEPHAKDVIAVR